MIPYPAALEQYRSDFSLNLPRRDTFRGRLLDEAYDRALAHDKATLGLSPWGATLGADGWKGIDSKEIINVTVAVRHGVIFVAQNDTFGTDMKKLGYAKVLTKGIDRVTALTDKNNRLRVPVPFVVVDGASGYLLATS